MSSWTYDAILRESREFKEQSLHDENGVLYMDHLWNDIKDEQHLALVLRDGVESYDDVSVRAWWSRGRYDWEMDGDNWRSHLIIEVPDEVTRRIQSRYAQTVMSRFFGRNSGIEVELDVPILADTSDEDREAYNEWDGETYHEELVDNWPRFKDAVRMTAADPSGHLGGQSISLFGAAGASHGLARIDGSDLSIYIPEKMIIKTQGLWTAALRNTIEIK